MDILPVEKLVIRYGSINGQELGEPMRLERDGPNFEQTGIMLRTGLNLADCIIKIKAPEVTPNIEIGRLNLIHDRIVYTPHYSEIGNILKRTQYDVDIIPDLADDEYPPKLEKMQEHILNSSTAFPLRRGDIIMARAYDEQIKNISGTYIEIYQIFRGGISSKL